MYIPTIILRANTPTLFEINGSMLGEADQEHPLSLPIAPDGVYYIGLTPLTSNFLPIMRKIELQNGTPQLETSDFNVICWPQGIIDISFTVPVIEPNKPQEPACLFAKHALGNAQALLFREGGVHLAIETEDETLFSHTVSLHGTGKLSLLKAPHPIDSAIRAQPPLSETDTNDTLLCAIIQSDDGAQCCCVRVQTAVESSENLQDPFSTRLDIQIVYEGKGDVFFLQDKSLFRIETLSSEQKFERRDEFDSFTGKLIKTEIGHFTCLPPPICSEQEAVCALLDIVMYDLDSELPGMLDGGLASITMENLHEFFGTFTRYASPPAQLSDCIVVGIFDDANPAHAKLFAFNASRDAEGKWRVTNAEEI